MSQEPITDVVLHVHGNSDPLPLLDRICARNGWIALDTTEGEFIHHRDAAGASRSAASPRTVWILLLLALVAAAGAFTWGLNFPRHPATPAIFVGAMLLALALAVAAKIRMGTTR